MFFKSKDFYIDLVKKNDIDEIIEVYNSNNHFLKSHLDKEKVENQWIIKELESMKEVGLYSCKIVEISSKKIIGLMDFNIGEETYLSLLMIHNDFKRKGFGKLIYRSFEEYVKSIKSKCIRIDVVTDYESSVLDFWIKNGFTKFKDVELNWSGKRLSALIMKKRL